MLPTVASPVSFSLYNEHDGNNGCARRNFGRKAGKMGHHLETADELAKRAEQNAAQDRRKKKKRQKKGERGKDAPQVVGGNESTAGEGSGFGDEVDLSIEEDASEAIFDGGSDDEGLPDSDEVKARMLRVVSAMEESFRAIRGAEPTPELFEPILVRAYGELTPLSAVAQVVITSANRATLTCYDPMTANAVRDAVRDSGLNFNPSVEEGVVIVPIPKVSMDTRKAIVKQLGKAAEASRQRVRRIRRAAQDVVKKGKDGKLESVSEDDAFRAGKSIDAATEEAIAVLNQKVEEKQASVMMV